MSASGKILQRFFKNAAYSDDEWDLLEKMLADEESWRVICQHFNITHQYYKAIKKHFDETGSMY